MSKQEIQHIIEEVKRGNEAAFHPFFKAYYQRCILRLQQLTQVKEVAEEVFMEAIYKFWQRFIKSETPLPNDIEGYIYQMAKNQWLDSKKKKQATNLDIETVEHYLFKNADREYNPLVLQENKQALSHEQQLKVEAIQAGFRQLGELCRKLLTETLVYQTKLKTLQEPFGFSTYNSIKSKVSQCKKKLKEFSIADFTKKIGYYEKFNRR